MSDYLDVAGQLLFMLLVLFVVLMRVFLQKVEAGVAGA